MRKKVVIIGGGLGGLFSGAILSKEGLEVVVLEKNATVGGGLQTFNRFGETFDTGMHVIGGMQEGGNIRRICQYLGIMDDVDIMEVAPDCTDKLYFDEDHSSYTISKGKMPFVDSLSRYFPNERDNLVNYVESIFKIAEGIDLFNLRPSSDNLTTYPEDFLLSADALISKYIRNPKLQSILAYMNPMYGGRRDQTPAFIHAIINVLYINGTSRFVGGSHLFANLLVDVIKKNGGRVFVNEEVDWIQVCQRHVDYVRTKKGKVFDADYYISDIHPCSMFRIMPDDAFPKSYRHRLDALPNSYSAFGVYIKVKENSFRYLNYTEYYMNRYEDIWNTGDTNGRWPLGFLFMTPPNKGQGEFCSKVLITAPMSFDLVRRWEGTTHKTRGKEYLEWKKRQAETIIDLAEKIHPNFRDCIDDYVTSSPLTIRDYYGVKEGALSGFSKDYKSITSSIVPVVTKISNLLLTGQNNNLHGFCGVPLTAINTCEALLGRNYIINRINQCV